MTEYAVWYKVKPMFDEDDTPLHIYDLRKRWKRVKTVEADSLEEVYMKMQGEVWSPNGEARPLIRSLGLSHTSMSVGDIAEHDGKLFIVADFGFKPAYQ